MTVREMTEADIPVVAALEAACFAQPWTKGQLFGAASRTDFRAFVAEDEQGIVGYICGTCLYEDADVARVAVQKERRREGLGGRLLDAFLSSVKAQGAKQAFLEVRVSNAAAIRLYESRAFASIRLRKRYYVNGEDGIEMKKEL